MILKVISVVNPQSREENAMQLGMVGLGRMGANIVRRLTRDGHTAIVYDHNPEAVDALIDGGVAGAMSLGDLVSKLDPPRTVWIMLPAGEITENTIQQLANLLQGGDTIIDGGNTFWKDDVRRGHELNGRGLCYLDVGTSGGVWGLDRGYCLMIGGDPATVARLDPIFSSLAPGRG